MDEVARIFGADEKFDARLEVYVLLAIATAGVVVLTALYWLDRGQPPATSASALATVPSSSAPAAAQRGEANQAIDAVPSNPPGSFDDDQGPHPHQAAVLGQKTKTE
jgi:hypothetical protein